MSAPHLPPGTRLPALFRGVLPLNHELGEAAGHRLMLLSLECWEGWADLRFARIDTGAGQRLTRRVPPAGQWRITADRAPLSVHDAVGRGDRAFSNGEVRLVPAPPPGSLLEVSVVLVEGSAPLSATVRLPEAT